MAKGATTANTHTSVFKRTNQGGSRPKTSSMNKTRKRNFKAYRGQGK
jgi:hypothetical protein